MKRPSSTHAKRDLFKLGFLGLAILGVSGIFVVTPGILIPTLLSIVLAALLSPCVAWLERRGYPRIVAIVLIFLLIGTVFTSICLWAIQIGASEWDILKEQAPANFRRLITKLQTFENEIKSRYTFLGSVHPTNSLLDYGRETGSWFTDHGPSLVGQILTAALLSPLFAFVLLNEGPAIKKKIFQLVPNRFFESFFHVASEITLAISDYVRAKLIEAILLGLMVTFGLAGIHAPYWIVLGILAAITNIIPYLGPFLGAIPAVLIMVFDAQNSHFALPVALVFIVANIIDSFVIFPVVVAKLVDLHPLILLIVVAVGQKYYGLIGMLVSVPIASAMKVVLQEIYAAIYEREPIQNTQALLEDTPILNQESSEAINAPRP